MSIDLFGEAPTQIAPTHGYAAMPGTGPAGETCKSCKHYAIKQCASAYRKCALMRAVWTGGAGTDIKASAPACSKWDKAP